MQTCVDTLLQSITDEDGTLILIDMMGGTPCNASVPMCKSFNIEILSGVNLPMVLSALILYLSVFGFGHINGMFFDIKIYDMFVYGIIFLFSIVVSGKFGVVFLFYSVIVICILMSYLGM